MSGPRDLSGLLQGPRDEAQRRDDEAVDAYVAHHFGVTEPPEDEPAPGVSEDEQFNEYFQHAWPGRTGTDG